MLTRKAMRRSAEKNITWKQLFELALPELLTEEEEKVVQRCEKNAISGDEKWSLSYHYKLMRLPTAPWILYRKGDLWILDRPLLAIVWPRMPSMHIQTITKDVCARLGAYELVTISWGADGIDLLAHECSMEMKVPTIVVLGAWFRRYRNRRERDFFERVVAAWGVVLSEWKLDQPPAPYTFPQRNRIIAGCAQVVFVPWASLWSWSLITVDFALQFGIPVVTVPWSYYEAACAWTNSYLCQKKIDGSMDLDAFLKQFFSCKQQHSWGVDTVQKSITEQEYALLLCLKKQAVSVASLVQMWWGNLSLVLETLLHLEMKQLIYSPEPWFWISK